MDDAFDAILSVLLIVGIIAGFFFFGWALYASGQDNPSGYGKKTAVCEYLGGTYHDDICVKDGTVVDVK